MEHLKKFESFNHRTPKRVYGDLEWEQKLFAHIKEPFSEKEINFFQKLIKENPKSIHDIDLGTPGKSHTVFIQLYHIRDDNFLIDIDITKLKDDWYLIYEPAGNTKFICDEWDEVLGYLGSQTNLKF